jgi:hypothetical protein
MTELAAIIRQFPSNELLVRRLYAHVPEFRSLCEDYCVAQCALERWRSDFAKAEDYRRLKGEIEEEIREFMENSLSWSHR